MQAIRTRYICPTNFKGSRYSAACEARTIYVNADDALDVAGNHKAACEKLLAVMGWKGKHYTGMVGGCFGHDWYWVFLNDTRIDATAQSEAA